MVNRAQDHQLLNKLLLRVFLFLERISFKRLDRKVTIWVDGLVGDSDGAERTGSQAACKGVDKTDIFHGDVFEDPIFPS